MTSNHSNNIEQDRALGVQWERNFCHWAFVYKKSITPMQIGRTGSAIAWETRDHKWKSYPLPDITIWTSPGEHHEIKHKNPTRHNCFGLEIYRFESLLWFSRETQQKVMYTIHNHDLSGGRDASINRLEDWITINIEDLHNKWKPPSFDTSYVDGQPKIVPIYYWSIDLWVSLKEFWDKE